MKIHKIESKGEMIYSVTFKPNFIEKIFGVKDKVLKYKDTGDSYTYGGGRIYIEETGRTLGNTMGYKASVRMAIDIWRDKF